MTNVLQHIMQSGEDGHLVMAAKNYRKSAIRWSVGKISDRCAGRRCPIKAIVNWRAGFRGMGQSSKESVVSRNTPRPLDQSD